jgi:hypothetical protein
MNRVARWTALAVFTLLLMLVPFALWEDSLLVWGERLLASASSRGLVFALVIVLLVLSAKAERCARRRFGAFGQPRLLTWPPKRWTAACGER